MDFKPKDLLFSDGSFELPFPWDEDTSHYNPQVGTIYSPRFEKEKLGSVAFGHEDFHRFYSSRPSICFQRLISRLIYYEFTRGKFNRSSTISTLFPSKNPIIRMLGDILAEIHLSNDFVHEALALQRQYENASELQEAGLNPEEWLEKAIKGTDIDLPNFESTCKTFCKSEFMQYIQPLIEYFSLTPPHFFPEVPLNREGGLDYSKIDLEIADRVVENFRSKYHTLPYSPWQRFHNLVSIAKQMEGDKHERSWDSFLQRVRNDESLEIDEVSFKEILSSNVCPNERRFCPVDTFYSEGIKIPFVDYGSQKRNFGGENFGKMFQCRVEKRPLLDEGNLEKKQEILTRQSTNEMSTVYKEIHEEKHDGKPLIQLTGCGLRRRGFSIAVPT